MTGTENELWTPVQTRASGSRHPIGSIGRGVVALLEHCWTSLGINCKIPDSWVAETNEVGDVRITIRIKKDRVA